jgi:hypothetical protein
MKIWKLTSPDDDRYAYALCVGSWSDGALCPECTASSEQRVLPLVFEWEPGSDVIGDFTFAGFGDDIAITKRVADALMRFGGFELGAIDMFQRRGLKPPKNPARVRKPRVWLSYQGAPLHALWVTKHVPLDFERSSVQVVRKCKTCGEKQFKIEGTEKFSLEVNEDVTAVAEIHTQRVPGKGFYIDERHLADAAIFRLMELDAMVLCTDTVKRFIESQGFTNIAFLECGETF